MLTWTEDGEARVAALSPRARERSELQRRRELRRALAAAVFALLAYVAAWWVVVPHLDADDALALGYVVAVASWWIESGPIPFGLGGGS